jgi:glutamyl-tRNA reductase
MLSGLHVVHKLHPVSGDSERIAGHGPVFKTCLRLIQINWVESHEEPLLTQGFEHMMGDKAYKFLLETVCGLHSPVVGETEVFGQFKIFRNAQDWSYPLNVVLDNLIADTKKIRGHFLTDLGGQSYGSIVRKYVRAHASVAFIGGGEFTKELLPWVYKEDKNVSLFVRQPEKAQSLLERYPKVRIENSAPASVVADVVIVAAPISSQELQAMVANPNTLVIDLRGESREDAATAFKNYVSLTEVFATIESNQKQILGMKAQALEEIDFLTVKRSLFEVMRPFGWEDICVW